MIRAEASGKPSSAVEINLEQIPQDPQELEIDLLLRHSDRAVRRAQQLLHHELRRIQAEALFKQVRPNVEADHFVGARLADDIVGHSWRLLADDERHARWRGGVVSMRQGQLDGALEQEVEFHPPLGHHVLMTNCRVAAIGQNGKDVFRKREEPPEPRPVFPRQIEARVE